MKALEKPIIRYNDPNGFDNELNTMNNMCQEEGYAGTYYLLTEIESLIRNKDFFDKHREEIFSKIDSIRAEYALKSINNEEDCDFAISASMEGAIKREQEKDPLFGNKPDFSAFIK
ncbi:MAG: hypothetical protein J6O56_05195 [Bacilli bacterium]|nr:hypothetical protein [Bacilli bacterium]